MNDKVKKLTGTAMIAVLGLMMTAFFRISLVPMLSFLKYDPKDVIIVLGGFIWGPLSALAASLIASLIEMVTFSESGIWGFIMNVLSTCSFAVTAALVYKKWRTLPGAVAGLVAGVLTMVTAMLLWNYLITPIYMEYPREAVAKLLIPAFLPFNAIKGAINASLAFLLYKPLITALRKARLVEVGGGVSDSNKKPVALWLAAAGVLVVCVISALVMNDII